MKLPEDIRLWVGGGATACALILGAGYFTVVAPHLSAAQTARGATTDAQQVNTTLSGQLTALDQQNRNLPAYVAALRTARTALPITAGLSDLTGQLADDSEAAHVRLSSVSIGAVSPAVSPAVSGPGAGAGSGVAPGAASGPGTAAAGAATGSTSSGSTSNGSTSNGSGAAAAAPAAGNAGSTAAGSTTAGSLGTGAGVTGAAGPAGQVFQIQVTLTTHGSLRQQLAFLKALQRPGTRAALVSSANLAPGGDPAAPGPAKGAPAQPATIDPASTMTTLMSVFVTPQTPAATAQLNRQLAARTAR